MSDSCRSLLDAEWQQMAPKTPIGTTGAPEVLWQYLVSPPFPAAWPPDSKSDLVYYAYAVGHSMSARLVDAVVVAAPWARVDVMVRRGNAPRIQRLSNVIRKIGIQGVRPLSKEEVAIFRELTFVEAYLSKLSAVPDVRDEEAGRMRIYFQTWCRTNGVILEALRPNHEEFFRWLACD